MFNKKKNTGFTLIELLVVIAIIALLISIVVPALRKVKKRARYTVCASNQRQIVTACLTYATENNDTFMENQLYWNGVWVRYTIPYQWSVTIVDNLLPYFGDTLEVISCPGNNSVYKTPIRPEWDNNVQQRMWACSLLYLPGLYDPDNPANWEDENPKAALPKVSRNQPDCLVTADWNIYCYPEKWGNVNHAVSASKFGSIETSSGNCQLNDILNVIEGSNRGYIDGHVGRVGPDEMGTNNSSIKEPEGRRGHYSHASGNSRPYFW